MLTTMNTTTTLTGIKKLAVYGALLGSLGAAAVGVGSGMAQADSALGSAGAVQIAAHGEPSRGRTEIKKSFDGAPSSRCTGTTNTRGPTYTSPSAHAAHRIAG